MNVFMNSAKGLILRLSFVFSRKCLTAAFFLIMLLPLMVYAQTIDKGNYFIAISHDGNTHDLDDIIAAPMNIAILCEQGLWSKVLHFEYNNNLGGAKASSIAAMRESVNGALEKWGADGSKVFDLQTTSMTVSAAAKANFLKAAQQAKSQGAKLYYACGGPMEAPYQMVSSLPADLRSVVHVISHGSWNETFKRQPSSRVWTDLIKITGGSTEIANQNNYYFNNPVANWKWLDEKGGRYSWLFSRNPFGTLKFDPSDAGMTYYIITGRGVQTPTKAQVQVLFNSNTPPPPPPPSTCVLPWQTANINVANQTYTYTSKVLNSSCATSFNISMDIQGKGTMETTDYCKVYYKVNGGTQQVLVNKTAGFVNQTFSKNNLIGNSIEIIINAKTSSLDEIYSFTNIKIVSNGLKASKIGEAIDFEENLVEKSIQIYPNPVSSVLNINFSEAELSKEIKIFNSVGQMVYSTKTVSNNAQINVHELKIKGIAVVQILNGNKLSNHKIQIK